MGKIESGEFIQGLEGTRALPLNPSTSQWHRGLRTYVIGVASEPESGEFNPRSRVYSSVA
jgi:hypothetical protein